jgi:transglutaminase/protease-like cytokinesis protein 3
VLKVGEKPKVSHAWNTIPFDGKMTPLDATWGAGSVDGNFNFHFNFTEFWWATPPDQYVYGALLLKARMVV